MMCGTATTDELEFGGFVSNIRNIILSPFGLNRPTVVDSLNSNRFVQWLSIFLARSSLKMRRPRISK